jgi:hypothetical protein
VGDGEEFSSGSSTGPATIHAVTDELLIGPGLRALFHQVEQSARRLETRGRYDMVSEHELLGRWRAGTVAVAEGAEWYADWTELVEAVVAAGTRFERVRVVPEPLTEYLRFELWLAQFTAGAGEAVCYLSRDQANALDLPAHDFWLLDGERLAILYFTADDRLLGAQLITDPAVVARHERWLDQAHAVKRRSG